MAGVKDGVREELQVIAKGEVKRMEREIVEGVVAELIRIRFDEMGYAGITAMDVQPHSDAYFHAISIQQVTNNIKTKTCSTNINTGNAIPTANAGLDYTVPKSTPFLLTGTGTDANGDTLTYCWEQFDNQTTTTDLLS